jgi:hypothetical protein
MTDHGTWKIPRLRIRSSRGRVWRSESTTETNAVSGSIEAR